MKREKSLIRRLYSKKSMDKLERKYLLLGEQKMFSISSFLWGRLFFSVLLFFFFVFFDPHGFFFVPFVILFFYFGVEYLILDSVIKRREKVLEREAIFFFEVLLLSLEGGRSLSSALYITSKHVPGELSSEVKKCFQEIHLGKSFSEAIQSLKGRIPSHSIHEVFLNLTESSLFGNDISKSLQQQLIFLREKRIMDVKGEISKLPTKISVISVLFFIPLMLLIVLAPLFLRFING